MNRGGREVWRVVGFSDAVFGFALTLLVVSLEVPDNFEGLKEILRGFIPFAATFALVCWIWFEHYAVPLYWNQYRSRPAARTIRGADFLPRARGRGPTCSAS